MRLKLPIQIGFRYGYPSPVSLATYRKSQAHSTTGTRSQVLFHDPSPGCFSPFPHGTGSLSVTREYLGLGGGPPGFTGNFTGSVLLGIPLESRLGFTYGGITHCADAFQRLLLPRRL